MTDFSICAVPDCGAAQFQTRSGLVCMNGHGGAPSVPGRSVSSLSPRERAHHYGLTFPKWPDSVPWVGQDGRLYGMWILGQDYRSKSGYYGSFPPNFLKRVMALFPDKKRILHLFSGSLEPGDYTRFDRRNDDEVTPDVQGEAENLSEHFKPGTFDLIVADPPYTDEDAERYNPGAKLPNRKKVLHECAKVLEDGGHIAWLDQVSPMYTKREYKLAGAIGLVRSTNHRFRVTMFYERVNGPRGHADVLGVNDF